MSIDPNDIADVGFVSEAELASTGVTAYRTDTVTGVASGTITVTSTVGPLINYDDPIQQGDIVVITGNAAAGTYTVDTADLTTFTVVEAISDAGAGTVEFRYPSGATRVGIDSSTITGSSSDTVQGVVEDLSVAGLSKVTSNDTTVGYLADKLTAGSSITITETNDGGNETLVIAASGASGGPQAAIRLSHSGTTDLNASATDNIVPWDTETFKDSGYTHSTVTNNSRVQVDAEGTYLIHVSARVSGSGTPRYQATVRLRANGTTLVGERVTSTYARFADSTDHAEIFGTWVVKLAASDYVEALVDRGSTRTSSMNMVANQSYFSIVNLTGVTGPQGPAGADGADGADELIKVSANDTTSGYLGVKLVAGSNITLTEQNDGGNETLQIEAAGIDDAAHEALDTLVHNLAEDAYTQYTYSGNKLTEQIVWETASMLKKIRAYEMTYTGNNVTTYVEIQYDAAGTESYRVTYTLTYSGSKVLTSTGVRT